MLEILLFCAMFLDHHCLDYDNIINRMECPFLRYEYLETECGEEDLQAQASPAVLTGPSIEDEKKDVLRSCVWTITAKDGYSIAINIIEIDFREGLGSWSSDLKVYRGKDFMNPRNEILDFCIMNHTRGVKTDLEQVTIVFQVYESFRSKTFKLQYEAYIKEGFHPNVYASLKEITTCSGAVLEDGNSSNSTFHFSVGQQENIEILVYYCVHPWTPLTNYWLISDPLEMTHSWDITCNSTVCRIFRDSILPISANYTFFVLVGQTTASVNFQVLNGDAPTTVILTNATSPYQQGSMYHFDCYFSGEPVPEAYWFFYPASRVEQCAVEHLPDYAQWNRLRMETFNQSKKRKNSEIKAHYVCKDRNYFYKQTISLTADVSGCLVCWAQNRHGCNQAIEAISAPDSPGDIVMKNSADEPIEGERYHFTCTVSSFNFNYPSWSFWNGGTNLHVEQDQLLKRDPLITVEEIGTATTNNLELRFERLTPDHAGYYTCTSYLVPWKIVRPPNVKEMPRRVAITMNLKVLPGPAFVGKHSSLRSDFVSVKFLEGTNSTLNCSSRGKKPMNYVWNKILSNGSQVLLDGYQREFVVITDSQAQEAQEYVCSVGNTAGNLTRRFYVQLIRELSNTTTRQEEISLEVTGQEETDIKLTGALSGVGTLLIILLVAAIIVLRWRGKVRNV